VAFSPLAGDVTPHPSRAMCHRPPRGMLPGQPGATGSRRWTPPGSAARPDDWGKNMAIGPAQLIALGSAIPAYMARSSPSWSAARKGPGA
jgi:hypothetical protein